jgi:hypothetical protein
MPVSLTGIANAFNLASWLKLGFRRISVRQERLDVCFTGLIILASLWSFGENMVLR